MTSDRSFGLFGMTSSNESNDSKIFRDGLLLSLCSQPRMCLILQASADHVIRVAQVRPATLVEARLFEENGFSRLAQEGGNRSKGHLM